MLSPSSELERRVHNLHQRAIVIDGHSDILIPVNEGKLDLGERVVVPDPATWQAPMGLAKHPFTKFGMSPHTIYFGPAGQYDVPRFKEGGVTAQVCAVYLDDDKLREGLRAGLEMTWQLRHAAAHNPDFELVTTAQDVRRVKETGKVGAILSFEGCEALGGDLRLLELYHALGLRIVSLTHTRRNIFADGCYAAEQQGGLTALGKALVRKLEALKIVVDLVHIGAKGFWEILELVSAPPILSHSTPTMFPNSDPAVEKPLLGFPRPRLELPRDREVLEALAARGGVLGLIWALHIDLDDVVRDIETALEVMGPDHVGLGSDLYGLELAPKGLEDISKVPSLTRKLVERGHSDDTILKFLGGNYLRVFEQVWGE